MATHSSVLGWEIPWIEQPIGLQSMGSQSQTQLSTHACKDVMGEDGHFEGIWQNTSVCIQSGERNHKII